MISDKGLMLDFLILMGTKDAPKLSNWDENLSSPATQKTIYPLSIKAVIEDLLKFNRYQDVLAEKTIFLFLLTENYLPWMKFLTSKLTVKTSSDMDSSKMRKRYNSTKCLESLHDKGLLTKLAIDEPLPLVQIFLEHKKKLQAEVAASTKPFYQ